MANITSEFKTKLEQDPAALVSVIVRLNDEPSVRLAEIAKRGLAVQRTFSLISAVAVQGKASACLALEKASWVLSIEEDRAVHTTN
jgi:hypothetical protein